MAKMVILDKAEGESTRYWVYRCLLEGIVNIDLLPGQTIVEQEMSQYLCVSRTPLRDALFQLSQEMFVTIVPKSRTFVSKIQLSLVEQTRHIRRCVEMDVMRKLNGRFDEEHLLEAKYLYKRQELANKREDSLLVLHLDERMHRFFFDVAGMLPVWECLNKNNLQFKRMRNLFHRNVKTMNHVVDQHGKLIAALEARDFVMAEDIMDKHLSWEGWDMQEMKEGFPEYVD